MLTRAARADLRRIKTQAALTSSLSRLVGTLTQPLPKGEEKTAPGANTPRPVTFHEVQYEV